MPLDSGTSTDGTVTDQAPVTKDRFFDVTTKIDGDKPWSRLRIIVSDDRGRRQVINDMYRRGQTVKKWIKAVGDPGSVRIEAYVNGKLVKDERH